MQITVRVSVSAADPAPPARTILVMSDDSEWRAVVCRVLGQEGYRTLTARHPGHALVEMVRNGGTLELLLTDGDQGQRRSDFPRIFRDHPGARLLHLRTRPRTRDQLLAAVKGATA